MHFKILNLLGVTAAAAAILFTPTLSANAAEESSVIAEESSSVYEDLTLSASLSTMRAYTGTKIKITANVKGGDGNYRYLYSCTEKNSRKTLMTAASSKSSYSFQFSKAGNYIITVKVSDGSYSAVTRNLALRIDKQTDQLKDNGTSLNANQVYTNEKIMITPAFTGGTPPYQYYYKYKNQLTGQAAATGFTDRNSFSYSFKNPGDYTFFVTVKDVYGSTFTTSLDASVIEKPVLPLSLDGSINIQDAAISTPVTATAKITGGAAPYEYQFSYRAENGDWVSVSDFGSEASKTFVLPQKTGIYQVRIQARDSLQNQQEKLFTVNLHSFSISNSRIGATNVSAGEPVILVAMPEYGYGTVKYRYSYRLENEDWTYLGDYVTNKTKNFTFSSPGKYIVRVGAKDENNSYTEKLFTVTVKALDISSSRVNVSMIPSGSSVTITSKAANNNGSVKYRYSYHAEGQGWTYTSDDYISSSTHSFTFPQNGVYFVRVSAKDNSNQVKDKQFTIYVYQKNANTVISSTSLQHSNRWSAGQKAYLPYGTNVNIIKQSGCWYMVRYNNTTGHVYNLAFGGGRNYSTINTSTLPIIADDLIFNQGKDMRALYNYVNSMGYLAEKNDSLENLCVYILKYRRGACYHRAALLYYLLNRAGYEVVRVTDGKDDYTGGSPHNWCIVKTADGWRHIDPTPIIGLAPMYLVTDKYIERYFSWNRTKYPACL